MIAIAGAIVGSITLISRDATISNQVSVTRLYRRTLDIKFEHVKIAIYPTSTPVTNRFRTSINPRTHVHAALRIRPMDMIS